MLKDLIWAIPFFAVIAVIVALSFGKAADKSEITECKKWAEQATQFEGFYLVQWQADQCTAHGITINTPVK